MTIINYINRYNYIIADSMFSEKNKTQPTVQIIDKFILIVEI